MKLCENSKEFRKAVRSGQKRIPRGKMQRLLYDKMADIQYAISHGNSYDRILVMLERYHDIKVSKDTLAKFCKKYNIISTKSRQKPKDNDAVIKEEIKLTRQNNLVKTDACTLNEYFDDLLNKECGKFGTLTKIEYDDALGVKLYFNNNETPKYVEYNFASKGNSLRYYIVNDGKVAKKSELGI